MSIKFSGEINLPAFERELSNPRVQIELTRICEELQKLAKEIYAASGPHPYTAPPTYAESFTIVGAQSKGRKGKALVNSDPVWVFVEFGAKHPGTGEEIEGWAPMRRASDVIASKVGD